MLKALYLKVLYDAPARHKVLLEIYKILDTNDLIIYYYLLFFTFYG